MSQKSIELIFFRQLVSYLAIPVFIIDISGNLIFCNDACERILNFNLSKKGEIKSAEWCTRFLMHGSDGESPHDNKLSHLISEFKYQLVHQYFYLKNFEDKIKQVEVFVIPITNQMNVYLGSVVFFQEIEK